MINKNKSENHLNTDALSVAVNKRSDNLVSYFLIGFFLTGLIFATFYFRDSNLSTSGQALAFL